MKETIYLTKYQTKKLQSGSKKNKETLLQLNLKNLSPIEGGYKFEFEPDSEQKYLLNQIEHGKGARLTLSPSNVKQGGFIPIPLIIAGIGALASAAGATVNTIINHNKAKNEIEELKNHFSKIEKTYAEKGGSPPLPKDLFDVDVNKANVLFPKVGSGLGSDAPQYGAGWADCRKKVEYKHVEGVGKVVERLGYIQAQEDAGNTTAFASEKASIAEYLSGEIKKNSDTFTLLKVGSILTKNGEGLINNIINKLPLEMHLPGYNYLGPGTYLDTKYPKNVAPINKLDEAAREHDLSYHFNRTVESRREADRILENKAWENFKNPSTGVSEKAASWLTTTIMKGKRMIGGDLTDQRGDGVYQYEQKLPKNYQNGVGLPSTKMNNRW